MKTLAVAAALILLAAPKPEFDVLTLKDGRKIKGYIVSQNESEVVLQTIFEGKKGETAGTATARYKKSDIARIVHMPDDARDRALARSAAFRTRHTRLADAFEKIKPARVRFMKKDGLRTIGTHFQLDSTCDETFVREVTFYLDELFTAYRDTYEIRRNAGRIKIYLLSDADEYRRFQISRRISPILNPAFYRPRENFIAAYNLEQKDEAARIRKKILDIEKEIREFKKKIKDGETKIRKDARKSRKEILAEVARAKGRAGSNRAQLQKIEKWKKQQLGRLADWEDKEKAKLAEHRKRADAAISKNRKVIANNNRVRTSQNRRMLEVLFHEAFHAFSRNFLWRDGQKIAVPRWLEEGLASYYEMSVVEAGELIHGAPHRPFLALLRKERHKLPSLKKLVAAGSGHFLVTHTSNEARSSLNYAMSWAVAHYMMTAQVPKERITAYVVNVVLLGADKVKAFETLMGKSVAQVEAELPAHLSRLK